MKRKIAQLTSKNDLNIGTINTRAAIIAPLEEVEYLESYINEIVTQKYECWNKSRRPSKKKSSIKEYITI